MFETSVEGMVGLEGSVDVKDELSRSGGEGGREERRDSGNEPKRLLLILLIHHAMNFARDLQPRCRAEILHPTYTVRLKVSCEREREKRRRKRERTSKSSDLSSVGSLDSSPRPKGVKRSEER